MPTVRVEVAQNAGNVGVYDSDAKTLTHPTRPRKEHSERLPSAHNGTPAFIELQRCRRFDVSVSEQEPTTQPTTRGAALPQSALKTEPAPQPKRQSRARKLLATTSAPLRKSTRKRAEDIARRTVEKIVSDPSPPTQPVPIVAMLKGTPFQEPVEARAKTESEARLILDLSVDLGAIMLRAGASSAETELAVIATCSAMGLPNAEVDLTSTSLTVHYSDPDGKLLTVVRVVRALSLHFAKLSSVHSLVADMVDGKIDYDEARSRLDAIRRQKRPYAEWFVTLAWGVLVMCFINLVGGNGVASILGFVIAIASDWFGKVLYRVNVPPFFVIMAQTVVVTLVAMVTYSFGLIASPQYMIAGGIVLLLPTVTLVSAVQDALTDFPLTAAGRSITLFMSFAGIVSGIAFGLYVGRLMHLREIDVIVRSSGIDALTTIVALFAAFLVAACGAIGYQAAKRTVMIAGIIGLIGFVVLVGLMVLGVGNILACFVSSTVVGFLCRPAAFKRGTPVIVLMIPTIFPLLQGLSIFSSVYKIVEPEEFVSLANGLSALFAALTANAAIGVGAILGDFIVRPFMKRRVNAKQQAQNPDPEESDSLD